MISPCVGCDNIVAANPNWCPSIKVKGKREPLCRNCFDLWNKVNRIDKGLDPVELHPDAYGWQSEDDPDDEGRRMDAWMDGPTGFQPEDED